MERQMLILQFALAVMVAGASAWVAQSWRQEGAVFFQEQEKLGGIKKKALELAANKTQQDIIEDYEAQARQEKGRLEGFAIATSDRVKEQGETERVKEINKGNSANAYAIETINGIGAIANHLADLSSTANSEDRAAYEIIQQYLLRAAKAQAELQALGWAPKFDCANGKDKAVAIAARLAQSLNGSPSRGFTPIP